MHSRKRNPCHYAKEVVMPGPQIGETAPDFTLPQS